MRVWFIPPAYLDNRRLVAAHNEIHCLRTCVLTGRQWTHFPKLFEKSLHFARDVHTLTHEELYIRKRRTPGVSSVEADAYYSNHATPFSLEGLDPSYTSVDFQPTEEMLRKDVLELREKWQAEGYYFRVGRLDLRELEDRYGLPLGESWEDAMEKFHATLVLTQDNEEWFRKYRSRYPKSRMRDRLAAFRSEKEGQPG